MLIRITLIIAIIGGLVAGGLNFLKVKEKIVTTIAERDKNAADRDSERDQKVKAIRLAKDTQAALDRTNALLVATTTERDTAVAEAATQTSRANALADTLKKAQTDRDSAQNELAAWKALGIPLENIKATLATLKSITEERDAIAEEKKILLDTNSKLKDKLDSILNPEHEVQMPTGLKGKVLVADPRYDFVILDIGDKQGVRESGRLLIHHEGKLVAKVQVKSVQADRCVANVMPGWRLSDIMEGDQVLY